MNRLIVFLSAILLPWIGVANVVERVLPDKVSGVKSEAILLNGDWQFQFTPKSKWTSIKVPGEAAMQGFAIEHDKPVLYKKSVFVPKDYSDKSVILRFDGVYSYARLWVNGVYVREHFGGFTRWEADVTNCIKVGEKNEVMLEVTDRIDEISYGSGYAHHPIGGILRDVTLYALPKINLNNFSAETLMDSLYQHAELKLSYTLPEAASLRFTLTDPKGKNIPLKQAVVSATQGTQSNCFSVENVMKWDAEHPNLYQLKVAVEVDGKETYHFNRSIGFRDISIKGNQMFVNGMPVKLRGACRHDIHPTLGRTTTAELDSLDAVIFKRANMNFVRTSHYPPSEQFLAYCDEMGLYVECESAICFVNTHRQKNYSPAASENDPLFTNRYMSQLQEMVIGFRSHASILFWSVGNECKYGVNFQLSYDWVKQADTTRPAVFSYPGRVEKGKKVYDILSMHYPAVTGNMNQLGVITNGFQTHSMPSLFDEWAHVPCYTYTALQDDPNIRDFWGISLDMMWSKLFDAQGGLGGAIWGYIDETFMVPVPKEGNPYWIEFAKTAKPADFQGNCVGYGEWGIVDVWRREKPEFWGTKKAYSPIRLLQTQVTDFTSGERLLLPVYNRFDHTNLSEVTMRYFYNNEWKPIYSPVLAPHQKGLLTIPSELWRANEELKLEFLTKEGDLIDAYAIQLGEVKQMDLATSTTKLTVKETDKQFIVKGKDFTIPFCKESGLITKATSGNEIIIEKGPFLNLDLNFNHNTGPEVRKKARNYIVSDTDWVMSDFSFKQHPNKVKVLLSGTYKAVAVSMHINIYESGELSIDYHTQNEPNGWLRESGVKFYLPKSIDALKWKRKGYWSYYPEGSFAGNEGNTPLYNTNKVSYGENPNQSWNVDTHNYYYFADKGAISKKPLMNIAKGMKENIYTYTLTSKADNSFSVISQSATIGCRLNKQPNEQLILYINNRWDYPEIAWGDYCKTLDVTPNQGKIVLQF